MLAYKLNIDKGLGDAVPASLKGDRLEAIDIFCLPPPHRTHDIDGSRVMELLPLPIEDRLLTVTKLSARALV